MNILTEKNLLGMANNHPWASKFMMLAYGDGSFSMIPKLFFRNWLDDEPAFGTFQVGRCSGIGIGSIAKYDSDNQKLAIGRFVAGGMRLKFLLNGQHESKTISMAMFYAMVPGMQTPQPPQYGDTVLKNDIWIGDEVMFLGGSTIENGCIIGARTLVPSNFKTEPYGVYVGSPARLVKFRFSERVREALLTLAWWDMPISWVKEHNEAFLAKLDGDEARALDLLAELESKKAA